MDFQTAQRLVLKAFLDCECTNMNALDEAVGRLYAKEQGIDPGPRPNYHNLLRGSEWDTVHEVVLDLIIQRVLTSGSNGEYRYDLLRLTAFGRKVATEQRWSPYDPDGYLKEVANQAPRLNDLYHIYVEEALRCFRGGCYLATAVMLGAASEGAILDLFQCLADAMKDNGQMPEFEAYEEKLNRAQSVFNKYGEFKKRFDPVKSNLPRDLKDDLDVQLDGVFNLIRYYRNSAGHPTGAQVERMTAFTSLVLFVPYCKRIEDVGNWLKNNAKELHQ